MSDATPIVGPWNADWREVAPTYEQIVRHAEKHTGRWWRWHPDGDGRGPPRADRLAPVGDAPSVSDNYTTFRWRGSTPNHWRSGALVCPCDAIGNPLRWDDAPVWAVWEHRDGRVALAAVCSSEGRAQFAVSALRRGGVMAYASVESTTIDAMRAIGSSVVLDEFLPVMP